MVRVVSLREGFIATKLTAPQWDERNVPRERLLNSLHTNNADPSVVCIVAAAGSGKSTFMSQILRSLEERGCRTAWISLDADDNNAAAFAGYFIAALGAIDSASESDQKVVLHTDNAVPDIDRVFDELVAYVSTIRTQAALFLDDFQHISNPSILGFVNRLVARIPGSFRLIIAGRTRPSLELGRPRVSGLLAEFDQEDLNFGVIEAEALLRHSHGLELAKSDFETLLATTEGWAAGLQLAALALRRHKGSATDLIRSFSGKDKDLVAYLAESVLNSQPESVRLFLLRTAPLRRMCASLCQATSEHPNCSEMLAHLERCKLFIIPLDRVGEWFRYHHLFSEFLQNQLRKLDPSRYESICDKASRWCEHRGMVTEAIQYSLDARHFERAADLIANRAIDLSQSHGDHYTILDWMRRLPEEYHARRPEIDLSHAWARAFSRDTDVAIELAERVLSKLAKNNGGDWNLPDAECQRLRHFAWTIETVAKACGDEFENCRSRAMEIRRKVPDDEPFMLAAACNSLSYAHLAKREFESAVQVAAEAYLYGARANSSYSTVWADFLHGVADIELGRLRSAQEHGLRAEASSGEVRAKSLMAALINAEIATQRCEFDKTRAQMEMGRSFAVLLGPVDPLILAFRNDARVLAWDGHLAKAREVLGRGRDIGLRYGYMRLYLHLTIEEATLLLIAGKVAEACETASQLNIEDEVSATRRFEAFKSQRNVLKLLQCRLMLAKGDAVGAVRHLSQLQYSLGSDASSTLNYTLRSVKAVALWQADRQAESVRELDRALALAVDDFCAYPIACAGRGLLPVLRAIADKRQEAASTELDVRGNLERWLTSVLLGERLKRVESSQSTEAGESSGHTLTSREAELLRLVEAGLPNKKLATSLLISEATVKWHLHNIYEKFGVANRTAAAAKARGLMLI